MRKSEPWLGSDYPEFALVEMLITPTNCGLPDGALVSTAYHALGAKFTSLALAAYLHMDLRS